LVVVGSDEQLTVRFRYATPSAPNPVFPGFSRYQNVNKEIIFRKREYQEYITPQNFGSGVFFCVNYDKINIIIKRKQV